MGDFPMMTQNVLFVINGAERVIVSQLVRSPGSTTTSRLIIAVRRYLVQLLS